VLALQAKIPVLGNVSRLCEPLFLRADAMISAGQKGRTLPETAVVTFINVKLSTKKFATFWYRNDTRPKPPTYANLCKTCALAITEIAIE
jgi:hypothetical protein